MTDAAVGSVFAEKLSVSLCVLRIAAYGLGLLFSLKTHREFFAGAEQAATGEVPWPLGLALATLAGVTILVALVSEVFVESVQQAAVAFGMTPAFVGFIVMALVGGAAEMASAFSAARKDRLDLSVGIALGSASQIARFVAPILVLFSYVIGSVPMDLQFWPGAVVIMLFVTMTAALVTNSAVGVVCRSAQTDGVPDFRHDALPVATSASIKGTSFLQTAERVRMLRQLLLGTSVSVCNIAIHAMVMVAVIHVARIASESATSRQSLRLTAVMSATAAVLMAAHLAEVLVWSFAYSFINIAPPGTDLVYFAFVNYTTLGYGDVTPFEHWHLLGPMTAMNGVLLFGWSTAVIFEVLRRTMAAPRSEQEQREPAQCGRHE